MQTLEEKIRHYVKIADPNKCITCGYWCKDGELQCDFHKRNNPIKDDKKVLDEKKLINQYKN